MRHAMKHAMRYPALAAVALWPAMASAVPPPAGSAAAEELSHFSASEREWIVKQHDQLGRWCCNEGDFDFVIVQQDGDTLRVKAKHPDAKRGIPQGWIEVPNDRRVDLSGQKNVPDVMAAWYYHEKVQCLIVGGGY